MKKFSVAILLSSVGEDGELQIGMLHGLNIAPSESAARVMAQLHVIKELMPRGFRAREISVIDAGEATAEDIAAEAIAAEAAEMTIEGTLVQ